MAAGWTSEEETGSFCNAILCDTDKEEGRETFVTFLDIFIYPFSDNLQ